MLPQAQLAIVEATCTTLGKEGVISTATLVPAPPANRADACRGDGVRRSGATVSMLVIHERKAGLRPARTATGHGRRTEEDDGNRSRTATGIGV